MHKLILGLLLVFVGQCLGGQAGFKALYKGHDTEFVTPMDDQEMATFTDTDLFVGPHRTGTEFVSDGAFWAGNSVVSQHQDISYLPAGDSRVEPKVKVDIEVFGSTGGLGDLVGLGPLDAGRYASADNPSFNPLPVSLLSNEQKKQLASQIVEYGQNLEVERGPIPYGEDNSGDQFYSEWDSLIKNDDPVAHAIQGLPIYRDGWNCETKFNLYNFLIQNQVEGNIQVSIEMFIPRVEKQLSSGEVPGVSVYGKSQYGLDGGHGDVACTAIVFKAAEALFNRDIFDGQELNNIIDEGVALYRTIPHRDERGFVEVENSQDYLPLAFGESQTIHQEKFGDLPDMEEFLTNLPDHQDLGVLLSQGRETFLLFRKSDVWYLFDSHRKRKDQLQEAGSGLHQFNNFETLINYLQGYVPSTEDVPRDSSQFEAYVLSPRF